MPKYALWEPLQLHIRKFMLGWEGVTWSVRSGIRGLTTYVVVCSWSITGEIYRSIGIMTMTYFPVSRFVITRRFRLHVSNSGGHLSMNIFRIAPWDCRVVYPLTIRIWFLFPSSLLESPLFPALFVCLVHLEWEGVRVEGYPMVSMGRMRCLVWSRGRVGLKSWWVETKGHRFVPSDVKIER